MDGARRDTIEQAQRRVLTALDRLEAAMTNESTKAVAAAAMEARVGRVASRQEATLARLDPLESTVTGITSRGGGDEGTRGIESGTCGSRASFPLPVGPPETSRPDDSCATAVRLNSYLASRGAPPSSFVRVPAQYYDEDLPFRAACLKAATVHHLCKTICMENTKCTQPGCSVRRQTRGGAEAGSDRGRGASPLHSLRAPRACCDVVLSASKPFRIHALKVRSVDLILM